MAIKVVLIMMMVMQADCLGSRGQDTVVIMW
jgi:hypothetical protein